MTKPPYVSKRQSWIRFLVSFIFGAAAAVLLCSLLRGPELGFLYDFLLRRRPALPIAEEILIIDTLPADSGLFPSYQMDNVLEPSAAASLVLTITEFGASSLILQVPVLGLTAGSSAREEDIRYHFDREFGLINRNTINFFDAIRTGSISPSESSRYVRELTELSERGKERLVNILVSRDEEGLERLERAALVFGNVRRPGDLLVQVIRTGEGGRPGTLAAISEYSRPVPDKDGVIRRIAPLRFLADYAEEHIIYSALKPRFRNTEIVYTESGPVLYPDDQSRHFLDLNGALLFEMPLKLPPGVPLKLSPGVPLKLPLGVGRINDFRRINMEVFLKYDEEDQNLRRLLGEALDSGLFSHIEGEENPIFLYDYALSLLDDLLDDPGEERKALWIKARNDYFASLENFFIYGSLEIYQQESLVPVFSLAEEKYLAVLELRTALETVLADSFCILGPGSFSADETGGTFNIQPARPLFPALNRYFLLLRGLFSPAPQRNRSDVEVSALLANSILTGRSIRPGGELPLFISAVFAVLLCAFFLRLQKTLSGLLCGLFISFIFGLGFSLSFIFSGVWFDPLVPAASAGTVTLVSFAWASALRFNFSRKFRSCYGPFISSQGLGSLIRKGKPHPAEIIVQNAVVVSIKNPELILQEDMDKSNSAAAAVLAFQDKASLAFKNAGGIAAGNGGDLVLACFGSPLEHIVYEKDGTVLPDLSMHSAPVNKAAGFLSELIKSGQGSLWTFGLDFGLCAFSWSPLSGYSVFGRPVIRSRTLSNLNARYHTRVIISDSVHNVLSGLPSRRLGVIKAGDGTKEEAYYELKL